MHELSVAQSILDITVAKARAEGATRIQSIRVTIGALTTYMDESLRFYWDSITEGTPAEGSTIEFTRVEGRLLCLCCSTEFATNDPEFQCPKCGSMWTRPLAGDECFVDSIDIDRAEIEQEEAVCR
jgi:hydrogenase nickel incorporation protein HypA/HybF